MTYCTRAGVDFLDLGARVGRGCRAAAASCRGGSAPPWRPARGPPVRWTRSAISSNSRWGQRDEWDGRPWPPHSVLVLRTAALDRLVDDRRRSVCGTPCAAGFSVILLIRCSGLWGVLFGIRAFWSEMTRGRRHCPLPAHAWMDLLAHGGLDSLGEGAKTQRSSACGQLSTPFRFLEPKCRGKGN